MPQIEGWQRNRIAVDAGRFTPLTDILRGGAIELYQGNDASFEVALFDDGAFQEVSNIASLTFTVKSFSGDPPESTDPALMSKTIHNLDNSATNQGWVNHSEEHAAFIFTQTETSIPIGNHWLAISALTTDSPTRSLTLGVGTLTVSQDGVGLAALTSPISTVYTKDQIDLLLAKSDWKDAVKAATVSNIALNSFQTIDGVTLINGDRILVKDQSVASENGIYIVKSGLWIRSDDADSSAKVTSGVAVFVDEGDTQSASAWALITNDPIVLNTTDLSFVKFVGGSPVEAGSGLNKVGPIISIGADPDGSIIVNSNSIGVGILATDEQHGDRGGGSVHALATDSTAGFISAPDKRKLNSIEDDADITDKDNVRTALANASDTLSVNGQRITALGTPTQASDAVPKSYIDALEFGVDWKASVKAASAVNISLTGEQTIDGVALTDGDRVLIKSQTAGTENGIYVVYSGAWSRSDDANSNANITPGLAVFVEQGTQNADTGWLLSNDSISLGTTDITFTQFTGGIGVNPGTGLTQSGNTLNVGAHADGSIIVNADDVQIGVLANDSQHGTLSGAGLHSLASDTEAGFLSAVLKRKLDGIADDADVTGEANVRAALALSTGDISVNSQKITSLSAPTDDSDAVPKSYVDAIGTSSESTNSRGNLLATANFPENFTDEQTEPTWTIDSSVNLSTLPDSPGYLRIPRKKFKDSLLGFWVVGSNAGGEFSETFIPWNDTSTVTGYRISVDDSYRFTAYIKFDDEDDQNYNYFIIYPPDETPSDSRIYNLKIYECLIAPTISFSDMSSQTRGNLLATTPLPAGNYPRSTERTAGITWTVEAESGVAPISDATYRLAVPKLRLDNDVLGFWAVISNASGEYSEGFIPWGGPLYNQGQASMTIVALKTSENSLIQVRLVQDEATDSQYLSIYGRGLSVPADISLKIYQCVIAPIIDDSDDTITAGAGLVKAGDTISVGTNPDGSIIVETDSVRVGSLPESSVRAALALSTGDIAVNSQKITNLSPPTDDSDAVPKSYVDAIGTGSISSNSRGDLLATATLVGPFSDYGTASNLTWSIPAGSVFSSVSGSPHLVSYPSRKFKDSILGFWVVSNNAGGEFNETFVPFNGAPDANRWPLFRYPLPLNATSKIDVGFHRDSGDNTISFVGIAQNPTDYTGLTISVYEAVITPIITIGEIIDAGDGLIRSGTVLNIGAPPDGSIIVEDNYISMGVLANNAQHGVRGGGTLHALATDTSAGFMSRPDKVKLDSINPSNISVTESAVRTALSESADTINVNGQRITSLGTPTENTDAVPKSYVDAFQYGVDWKESVRATTTENIALSGQQTIDTVSLVIGNRVLVKDQTDASENGIYIVASGTWSRSTDADIDSEVTTGLAVFIEEGLVYKNEGWVLITPNPIVLSTTDLQFIQFTGLGEVLAGQGLTKFQNTINIEAYPDGSIAVQSDYIRIGRLATDYQHSRRGGGNLHSAVTTTASGFMTGPDKVKLDDIEDNADVTDEANVRTALSMATGNINVNSKKITELATPTNSMDATPKNYVDNAVSLVEISAGSGLVKSGQVISVGAHTDASIVVTANQIRVGVLASDSQHGARGGGSLHDIASASQAGFLSSADKIKLDTVSEDATPTTEATVRAALANLTQSVSFNNRQLTGVGTPIQSADATNKSYVDALSQGVDWKHSVRATTTSSISLSGLRTIDGISLALNDRVLVKNQSNARNNGIYVASAGTWARSSDADDSSEVTSGLAVFVHEGNLNADTGWLLTTNDPITLGTSQLNFTQFTGLGALDAGAGLTKTGNRVDIGADSDGSIIIDANSIKIGSLATDTQHGNRGRGSLHLTATTSTAGFLSASDKSKLNSVERDADVTDEENVRAGLASAVVNISVNSKKITNLLNPTNAQDAVTKNYNDSNITLGTNLGSLGIGVFKQKSGRTLQFKRLRASSTNISIFDDSANNRISFDVPDASTTRKGLVEKSTDLEASTGTEEDRFINSKQLFDNTRYRITIETNTQRFTSSGIWNNPGVVIEGTVEMYDGGEGGGKSISGGGNGGGYRAYSFIGAGVSSTEIVVVGAGGIGAGDGTTGFESGGDGGISSFGEGSATLTRTNNDLGSSGGRGGTTGNRDGGNGSSSGSSKFSGAGGGGGGYVSNDDGGDGGFSTLEDGTILNRGLFVTLDEPGTDGTDNPNDIFVIHGGGSGGGAGGRSRGGDGGYPAGGGGGANFSADGYGGDGGRGEVIIKCTFYNLERIAA